MIILGDGKVDYQFLSFKALLSLNLMFLVIRNKGSGALLGKMLLERIVENNKLFLGQVRLSKGWLCPAG